MGFQQKAHMALVAAGKIQLADDPQNCNKNILQTGLYSPGTQNQCKWKAHPLCGGQDCLQKQAIDGSWGRNTEATWQMSQDMQVGGSSIYDLVKADCGKIGADDASTGNWQIPANMSNIKFHTNRQVALQMAVEEAKRTVGSTGSTKFVLDVADMMYAWLQDAPMKDEDHKEFIFRNKTDI